MKPPNQVLLVKGHRRVVLDHPEEARGLYGGLADIFQAAGLTTLQCDSRDACKYLDHSEFLVGHSHGTRTVLALYDPARHRDVRGIILLDPSDADWKIWESLTLRRRAFVSRHTGKWWCQENWSDSIYVLDTHWFLKSLPLIRQELKDIRDW